MPNDLCTECGASWDCEHRAKAAVGYVPDPYGPPIAVEKEAGPPSKVELEDRIMAAVAERPGLDRETLARECKQIGGGYQGSPTDFFKATLRRLVSQKLLLQTLHGRVYVFESGVYLRDLKLRIDSEERSVQWATEELASSQKRLSRRQKTLEGLRQELERAERLSAEVST